MLGSRGISKSGKSVKGKVEVRATPFLVLISYNAAYNLLTNFPGPPGTDPVLQITRLCSGWPELGFSFLLLIWVRSLHCYFSKPLSHHGRVSSECECHYNTW